MKKITALILVLMMALSCFAIASFAAEEAPVEGEPVDETTVRAYTYDENTAHSPSVWLNTFDEDGNCTGTDYVIFNCAAALKGIGLPEVYAGKSVNLTDCDVRFELFKFDTDAEKTLGTTPLFSTDVYFDGDRKDLPYFTFSEPFPAGQYLFRITQLTGVREDGEKPYSVLPINEMKYSETQLEFDQRGPFVFFIECEKTEGVTDYFLKLGGKEEAIDIQPEKTVIPRGPGGAHALFEYAIVTPEVPEGQVLFSLALVEAPTWCNTNGDSDVMFEVYKWTGDYEESLMGDILCTGEIFNHADNSNLTMKFGTAMRYGHRYLLVIYRSNNGAIGYYEGVPDIPDGWEFYEGSVQLEYGPSLKVAYALVGDLGPEPTPQPTAEPTQAPTEAPATEPPAVTDAPAPTEAVKTEAPKDDEDDKKDDNKKDGNNSLVPIIIIGVCVAAVIAAVIVILVAKKKKK